MFEKEGSKKTSLTQTYTGGSWPEVSNYIWRSQGSTNEHQAEHLSSVSAFRHSDCLPCATTVCSGSALFRMLLQASVVLIIQVGHLPNSPSLNSGSDCKCALTQENGSYYSDVIFSENSGTNLLWIWLR